MDGFTKVVMTFGVLVIMITGMYFFTDWFSKTTGYVLGEDEKVKLAQCLDGEGAVFYFESNCVECEEQIQAFGETAVAFVPYVDCTNNPECDNLRRLPAWEINGDFYYGFKDLKELIDISGCVVDDNSEGSG